MIVDGHVPSIRQILEKRLKRAGDRDARPARMGRMRWRAFEQDRPGYRSSMLAEHYLSRDGRAGAGRGAACGRARRRRSSCLRDNAGHAAQDPARPLVHAVLQKPVSRRDPDRRRWRALRRRDRSPQRGRGRKLPIRRARCACWRPRITRRTGWSSPRWSPRFGYRSEVCAKTVIEAVELYQSVASPTSSFMDISMPHDGRQRRRRAASATIERTSGPTGMCPSWL